MLFGKLNSLRGNILILKLTHLRKEIQQPNYIVAKLQDDSVFEERA